MLKQLSLCAVVVGCFAVDSLTSVASASVAGKTYNTDVTFVSNLTPEGETIPDTWTFVEDGTVIFLEGSEGEWLEVDLFILSIWVATYSEGSTLQYAYAGIASGTTLQGIGAFISIAGVETEIGVSTVFGTEAATEGRQKRIGR